MRTFTGYGSSSKGRRRTSKSPYSSSNLGYGNVGYSGFSGSVGYDYSGATLDLGYGYNSGSGSYTGFWESGYPNGHSSSGYNNKTLTIILEIEVQSKSSGYASGSNGYNLY